MSFMRIMSFKLLSAALLAAGLMNLTSSAPEALRVDYRSLKQVVWLQNDTFEKEVANGRWFVIFYRSSCGGCKMYYPYFQMVANQVEGWPKMSNGQPFVNLGSVDCDTAVGKPVCVRYNVTGVPNLQYFTGVLERRKTNSPSIGLKPHKNATMVVRDLVAAILEETTMVPETSTLYSGAVTVESSSRLENTLIILEFQRRVHQEMKSFINPAAKVLSVRKPNGGVIVSGSPESVRQHLLGKEEYTDAPQTTIPDSEREDKPL